MIENNNIYIFPQSEKNLHPKDMPNLGKFSRDLRGITQNNYMPRKGFKLKRLKEIMNPVPIVLSMPRELENM